MGTKQSTVRNTNSYPLDMNVDINTGETCHVKISKRPSMPSETEMRADSNTCPVGVSRASKRRAYSESETIILEDQRKMRKLSQKDFSKRKPPFQEILLWKDSFNSLISHPIGIELFRRFLRSEHSEESIQFWCACEDFRSCKFRMQTKAKKIFRNYVQVDSACQVNLDYKERNQIEQTIKTPNRYMFDEAQHKIKYLMLNDSYPRFLRSSIYKNLEQKIVMNN